MTSSVRYLETVACDLPSLAAHSRWPSRTPWRLGLLQAGQVLAVHVLSDLLEGRLELVEVADLGFDRHLAGGLGRAPAALAEDELIGAVLAGPDEDRLCDAAGLDGLGQPLHVTEFVAILGGRDDLVDRDEPNNRLLDSGRLLRACAHCAVLSRAQCPGRGGRPASPVWLLCPGTGHSRIIT